MRPDERPLLEEAPPGDLLNPDDRLYPFTCHEEEPVEPVEEENVTKAEESPAFDDHCLDTCIHECLLTSGNLTEEPCNATRIDDGSCNTTVLPPTGDYLKCVRGCTHCLAGPIDWS